MLQVKPSLDMFRLMDDVRKIAQPIANNKGLWRELDDIVQETFTQVLEDHRRYECNSAYLNKLSNETYYKRMIRNKAIKVCDLWSDPFCYYYEPWWVAMHMERLLHAEADNINETIEVADFRRAFQTLTTKQKQSIIAGKRSGTAFDKLVKQMNKGHASVPYQDVDQLV